MGWWLTVGWLYTPHFIAMATTKSHMRVASCHLLKLAFDSKKWGPFTFELDRPRGFVKTWDQPDGSVKTYTYPVDYGFFVGHTGQDDEGLDAFVGDDPQGKIESFLKMQRDEDGKLIPDETKFLVGLTEDERAKVIGLYKPEEIVGLREYTDFYELLATLNAFRDRKASKTATPSQVSYVKVLLGQGLKGLKGVPAWLTDKDVPSDEDLAKMDGTAISTLIDALKARKPFTVQGYGDGSYKVTKKASELPYAIRWLLATVRKNGSLKSKLEASAERAMSNLVESLTDVPSAPMVAPPKKTRGKKPVDVVVPQGPPPKAERELHELTPAEVVERVVAKLNANPIGYVAAVFDDLPNDMVETFVVDTLNSQHHLDLGPWDFHPDFTDNVFALRARFAGREQDLDTEVPDRDDANTEAVERGFTSTLGATGADVSWKMDYTPRSWGYMGGDVYTVAFDARVRWVYPEGDAFVFALGTKTLQGIAAKLLVEQGATNVKLAQVDTSVERVVSRHTEIVAPLVALSAEVENLEALWSDVLVILTTFTDVVPMPHVGRIAALQIHSQTECVAKCEQALRNCERVVTQARAYLQSNPGDPTASAALRDAQLLYVNFEAVRGEARQMLSALSQKLMPVDLKAVVTTVLYGLRAKLKQPNRATVIVAPRFAPYEVNGRTVSGMVFDAYVTVYPAPLDTAVGEPRYQQFVLTQATLGDTVVYLQPVDRTGVNPVVKPTKVTDGDGALSKVRGLLKGWGDLES